MDQAAQEVASQLVGAERMQARWLGQAIVEVHLAEPKRRQSVGEDAHQDQHQEDGGPDGTQRVLPEQPLQQHPGYR